MPGLLIRAECTNACVGVPREAAELRQLLHDRFFVGPASAEDAAAAGAAADVRPPTPAVPIPWYPDSLGWTMRASRVEMRRARHLEDLRQYLVMQTELVRTGALRPRQRASTME